MKISRTGRSWRDGVTRMTIGWLCVSGTTGGAATLCGREEGGPMITSGAPALPVSGRQVRLAAGAVDAVVVQVGGGLRELRVDGVPVLDGYAEVARYAQGQALVPWPNRVGDGRYVFAEREFQLPLSEPANDAAIHGLARWLVWEVLEERPASATLAVTVAAQAGYPFMLRTEVVYTVTPEGIGVRTSLTNIGSRRLPAGHGFHPYLTVGIDPVDDALLRVPGATRLEADDRGLPTGSRVAVDGTKFDFREPRRIGGLQLDTAFAELIRDRDGCARVRLARPDGGRRVTLWMDDAYRYVMAFTGDGLPDPTRRRRSVGIEPMTCPPNAFASGEDLTTLKPGETTGGTWASPWTRPGGPGTVSRCLACRPPMRPRPAAFPPAGPPGGRGVQLCSGGRVEGRRHAGIEASPGEVPYAVGATREVAGVT